VSRLERPDAARVRAAEQALRDAEDEVTATQLARAEAQEQVDEIAQALDEAKELLAEAQLEARKANRARDAAAAALERLRRRGS
jgi:chromosome segregation ATPase